jgi:hypothetical protein
MLLDTTQSLLCAGPQAVGWSFQEPHAEGRLTDVNPAVVGLPLSTK